MRPRHHEIADASPTSPQTTQVNRATPLQLHANQSSCMLTSIFFEMSCSRTSKLDFRPKKNKKQTKTVLKKPYATPRLMSSEKNTEE
jgi:hypothetical protein